MVKEPLLPKPLPKDVDRLVELMRIYLSEPMRQARQFWRTVPDGLGFEELMKKYPRGSVEFENISSMMIFWETVGGLVKHGLVSEELAFDTFLDAPPWKKMERFFRERREKEKNPFEGENLELMAESAKRWIESRRRKE